MELVPAILIIFATIKTSFEFDGTIEKEHELAHCSFKSMLLLIETDKHL